MNKLTSGNDYFQKYGLQRDPFPPDVIDKKIFLTPEINRRLKLVKQHVKDSQKLLLVSSASGAGKSLLAQKILILKEPDWRISLTSAHENMKPELLAYSVVKQLLPEKQATAIQAISILHKYLEQSYREAVTPVIVIDDAHKLPFEALQFVLQLADLRYNETLFRVVLFANESITEIMAKPGLKELAGGMVDIVSMPCFSQEQIRPYFNHRFSSCGDDIELPFTEDDIKYIHRASAGLPGGANILARQLMQDALNKGKSSKANGGMALLLSFLLLVLAGYLYYENRLLKDHQATSLEEAKESPAAAPDLVNTLIAEENAQFKIKQKNLEQESLSSQYQSLSLKLSDVLLMQPAGN